MVGNHQLCRACSQTLVLGYLGLGREHPKLFRSCDGRPRISRLAQCPSWGADHHHRNRFPGISARVVRQRNARFRHIPKIRKPERGRSGEIPCTGTCANQTGHSLACICAIINPNKPFRSAYSKRLSEHHLQAPGRTFVHATSTTRSRLGELRQTTQSEGLPTASRPSNTRKLPWRRGRFGRRTPPQ